MSNLGRLDKERERKADGEREEEQVRQTERERERERKADRSGLHLSPLFPSVSCSPTQM